MAENDGSNWTNRVVCAIKPQPTDSITIQPEEYQKSSNSFRRVTVSGKVAASTKLNRTGSHLCGIICYQTDLEDEQGKLLLAVDGQDVTTWEQIHVRRLLAAKEKNDRVVLWITEGGGGNVLFNHPKLVIRLGLVEVLRAMVDKGFVHATTVIHGCTLLCDAYMSSVDAQCFFYMISLPDVDCSQIFHSCTILQMASCYAKLALGIDAYRAIAQHPTANINAQLTLTENNRGDTALHRAIMNCHSLESCGSIVVSQIKVLLEAGVDPLIRSRNGAALEFFDRCRKRPCQTSGTETKMFDCHFDEIDALLKNALHHAH